MDFVPLGTLANVRSGMTFNPQETDRTDDDGKYRLVRIGDLTDEGEILDRAEFPRLSLPTSADTRLVLSAEDILFPARGARTTAAVYTGNPSNAVVGSQFFVIRLQGKVLTPEFLAWYFTTDAARQYFNEHRGGTHVQFISRAILIKFLIPVPSLDIQRNVADLFRFTRQEKQFVTKLYQQRQRLVEASLFSPIKS